MSDIENAVSSGDIAAEMKDALIAEITTSVPEKNKMILLVCMCLIPMVFVSVAMIIYKKKFHLNEKELEKMMAEVRRRKAYDEIPDGDVAEEIGFGTVA